MADLMRLVTSARHPPYGHRTGIFRAAYALERQGGLSAIEDAELQSILAWFSARLAIPDRFAASRHPRSKATAISWVRVSATEHITQLRRLAALLEISGVVVDELRTKRPGYVLFEDEHQVVAVPFADTPH